MCFLKQSFLKMEELRGLFGFSKVVAQASAEQQSMVKALEFMVTCYIDRSREEWYIHNSQFHLK